MCLQDNKLRAFGAGLLSSASELEVSNTLHSSTTILYPSFALYDDTRAEI